MSGHLLSNNVPVPTHTPFSDLHTISFTYKENYTATDSRLEVYWDGVFIDSVDSPYSPIRWDTGNNLYIGRFSNQVVNGVSYVGDLKVFKKALSSEEILEQHLNRPSGLVDFEADKVASTP